MNTFHYSGFLLVSFLLLHYQAPSFQEEAVLIPVKVVKKIQDSNLNINTIDFMPISSRLLEQRQPNASDLEPAPFPGPELLQSLVGQCFLFDDSKYIFRVCPFANVTQHEKSPYAFNFLTNSFHAILGIWHKWYVSDNVFDSLLYLQGDRCEHGFARKVRLQLQCSNDWTMTDLAYVKNVTEIEKCVYLAQLASSLFCKLGTVYSRLDSTGQMEWNVLETLFRNGRITRKGYEYYLQMILVKYGLTTRDETSPELWKGENTQLSEDSGITDKMNLCENKLQQLEKEISELKSMLQQDGNNKT